MAAATLLVRPVNDKTKTARGHRCATPHRDPNATRREKGPQEVKIDLISPLYPAISLFPFSSPLSILAVHFAVCPTFVTSSLTPLASYINRSNITLIGIIIHVHKRHLS